MLEADLRGDLTDEEFVAWVGIGVSEYDGDGSVPGIEKFLELRGDLGLVQRFEDLDGFTANPLDNLARPINMPILIVLFPDPGISSSDVPRLVEFNSMFLKERIRGVAYESDAFVHFDDVGVEGRRSFDVEVEYTRTGLITDTEKVFESSSMR